MGSRFDTFPYRDLLRKVLDSDYRRKKSTMSSKHIPVSDWLEALNLLVYRPLFVQYGGVEELIYATEAEIKDLGVKHGGHRAKIVSSLRILREKYEKGTVTRGGAESLQHTSSSPYSTPPSPTTAELPQFAASTEKLQADLKRELEADPSELRSRCWYHGNISRQRAESLVIKAGDFLVRDCISKPGDFVLTCRWKGVPLNFMINSIVGDCPPGSLPTISYQFEDDNFVTIQQLIEHYRHNSKPVTLVSGAVLKNPISRSMPLSYYDSKYGALIGFAAGIYGTPTQSPKHSPFVTPRGSPESSPEMSRRKATKWTGSQPVLNVVDNSDLGNSSPHRKLESRSSSLDRCDSLPFIHVTSPAGMVGQERTAHEDDNRLTKPTVSHFRAGSAPVLTPDLVSQSREEAARFQTLGRHKLMPASSEGELTNPAPPKPSRIPSIKYKQKPTVVVRKAREEDDDRDYSDYTQVKQAPSWLHGSQESQPRLQEDTPRQVTFSSPSPDQLQKGRNTHRVQRDKKFIPSKGNEHPPNNMNSTTTETNISQQNRLNVNSRVPPVHIEDPSDNQLQTYKIVARSRSFQTAEPDVIEYDNNLDNLASKGYKTLPGKKSLNKLPHFKSASNVDLSQPRLSPHDYDYPKTHADIFGYQSQQYLKSRRITKPQPYPSTILPEAFRSPLLPNGHKVLDQSVLLNVKALLLNKTPKAVALHLTHYDLTLINVINDRDFGVGVTSGLELLTLPQGKQLRRDIIERWDSLRMFAMLTLLTSQNIVERADVLSLWIQTCLDLKTTAGNLFSFAAIMSGLMAPQVIRLTETWSMLRRNHTSSAYAFDTKLRPALVSLNDASSDLPLNNVSVPYVTPVCLLLERDFESILQEFFWERELVSNGSMVDVLLAHLDTARIVASQGNLYRVTGQAVVSGWSRDHELEQVLCPEFHLLVLWGEKGWAANRKERLDKLEQISRLFSNKYQPPSEDDGTEV